MSKYSDTELRQMAQDVCNAHMQGDPRGHMVLELLVVATGKSMDEVIHLLEYYANGKHMNNGS